MALVEVTLLGTSQSTYVNPVNIAHVTYDATNSFIQIYFNVQGQDGGPYSIKAAYTSDVLSTLIAG